MAGHIKGITTLNGTARLLGTLSTTNDTSVAAPALGVSGGTGDK